MIFADCSIIGDDVTLVSKIINWAEVGAIDTDLRRTVHFSWRELVHHLGHLQAEGEAEVLGCIREMADDVL